MQIIAIALVVASMCAGGMTSLVESAPSSSELSLVPSNNAVLTRAKRQCGGMGGCCAGQCGGGCGQMGQCGQTCCAPPPCTCGGQPGCGCGAPPPCTCGAPGCGCVAPPPPPCACGQPGCGQCTSNTQLMAVTKTCCTCCRPVCTQACVSGGGCACGCARGGCGRKRRSLLAIAEEETAKMGMSYL